MQFLYSSSLIGECGYIIELLNELETDTTEHICACNILELFMWEFRSNNIKIPNDFYLINKPLPEVVIRETENLHYENLYHFEGEIIGDLIKFIVFTELYVDIFEDIKHGDLDEVKEGLTSDLDIDFQDPDGMSLLMQAACYGHEEICVFLLDLKPDVILENKDGKSAVDLAEENGHDGIAAILRDYQEK